MTNNNNQKLDLTWIGKDFQSKLGPRILIEYPDKSYGDRNTEHMLIYVEVRCKFKVPSCAKAC